MKSKKTLINLYNSYYNGSLNEQMSPETLMVKLGGDEKTELKVTNQTDANGNVDLSNVTLEFKGEKYEGLEFKFEEVLEDHDNEGKDALFVAESDDKMFEVEVNIDANYDQSGIIDDVEWRSLETFPTKEDQQGIKEEHLLYLDEELDKKTMQVAKAFGNKGGAGKNASLTTQGSSRSGNKRKSPTTNPQITEKDLDVRSKAIEKRKTLIKNKLKKISKKEIKEIILQELQTLNEIEYCDPNQAGACGEGKECTYINSAFQYQCCPGGAGCPEAQISTNTGKGDVQALSPKRKKTNKPVRRKSMMNLRRMKNM